MMKYTVQVINGVKVFVSNKSGKVLTGAAKAACEKAEAKRQTATRKMTLAEAKLASRLTQAQYGVDSDIDECEILCLMTGLSEEEVELDHICDWYEANKDIIDAETEAFRRECEAITNQDVLVELYGATLVPVTQAEVRIWPSAFGQGFTREQAHAWLAEIRTKRHAERVKLGHDTAHKTETTKAIDYVAHRILGGKAIREGKDVKIVFTRTIKTMRDLWEGLPPRCAGHIGAMIVNGKAKAWVNVNFAHGFIWIVTQVSRDWVTIPMKGGDKTPRPRTKKTSFKFDESKISITGWAFTRKVIDDITQVFQSDEKAANDLIKIFWPVTLQTPRLALEAMGWKYNSGRGVLESDIIRKFLEKRIEGQNLPITGTKSYDVISVVMALQALNRCLIYAKKQNPDGITTTKTTRPALARLCLAIINHIRKEG